jgi:hypothetical protein
VGSTYAAITGATTVPDMGGRTLRGKNNGNGVNPDGELSLGAIQGDQFGSHTHVVQGYGAGSAAAFIRNDLGGNANLRNLQPPTAASGGNETRMKNVTVNIFIKIN